MNNIDQNNQDYNFCHNQAALKEIITFIQQGCIKIIKSDKDFYIVTKHLYIK